MNKINFKAYAKINWYLDIEGKHHDGYHFLQSIMQPISLHDSVCVSLAAEDSVTCSIPSLANKDNLAFRAWQLLKERLALPYSLSIHIEKNIPVAAGLGGGSSDAAAVLIAANDLFLLNLSKEKLIETGLALGADVPFFIGGQAAAVSGIGEKMIPLENIPKQYLILVNAGIPLNTAAIYTKYDEIITSISKPADLQNINDTLKSALTAGNTASIGQNLFNALSIPACMLCPEIDEILTAFKELGIPALLSGSGGTVFGLASSYESALEAAALFRNRFPFAESVYTIANTANR